jgi:hypothetical protein
LGSIESILSLLIPEAEKQELIESITPSIHRQLIGGAEDHMIDWTNVEYKVMNIYGLLGSRIVTNLAKDPLNSLRIRAMRGLVTFLIHVEVQGSGFYGGAEHI